MQTEKILEIIDDMANSVQSAYEYFRDNDQGEDYLKIIGYLDALDELREKITGKKDVF